MERRDEIEPIELSLTVMSTPQAVFRTVTSQTELRRWWAPRIIMSRHLVSQRDGEDVEMRLLQSEDGRLVRYQWRPTAWASEVPHTVITFEILDLGESRGRRAGEGIRLNMIHDNWVDETVRESQAEIWKSAWANLKDLLNQKSFRPWWESNRNRSGYDPISHNDVRLAFEKIEKENKGKPEKKLASQVLVLIARELQEHGEWFVRQGSPELEFRTGEKRIFVVQKNGQIILNWREIEKYIGNAMQEFADRLAIEQDLDLHIGKSQDKIAPSGLHAEMWSRWCIELIRQVRECA